MRVGKTLLMSGALAGALVLGRGVLLIPYEPETSNAYVWGAFHVHSTLSDGLSSLEEIADAARKARVGFVMLSEHGSPHSQATTLSRTIRGVRFIGGSEIGLPEGHLIASDARSLPEYKLPPYPPDATADIREWGGLSIITYPEDPTQRWSYWEDDFVPDGIEIINVTSYFRASSAAAKLKWALYSPFNRYYYIEAFTSPSYALHRWDELLTRGPVVGFYAANAHGGFTITDEMTVPLPSYETAFTYAGLGISPAHRDSPEEAIRRGEFFSLVRAAGEPQKFEIARQGDTIRVVVQTASLSPRIDLKRNGIVVASAQSGELAIDAKTPGVYRAEVYLPEHPLLSPDVPWILSNPLFVGVEFSAARTPESSCASFTPLPLEDLTLEKDDESKGSLAGGESGELELDYELSRATPQKIDRWVALALRRPIDLSRFKAIYLEAESSDVMRYWLELRAGERSHYASFKLEPGVVNRITLPWNRFYSTTGVRSIPKLWELDALFVTVNTSNSQTGFRSQMTLKKLGGCE